MFTNLSEAYTADNAYIAIYCFLEGSSGSGKDILEEIEKRIPKTGGGDGYGLSQTNKAYCLSSQALMHAAKAYGGFGDLVERMKYERLKKLRERHGLYEDSKSKGTTKATASMAFLACLYNDKQHAKELLGLLSKFKTHEGLYKAAHNENAIYTEDNALVAIASFLSA